uniref:hypothetical protein n=1 Tax=Trichocoleus desertorum TaxID=1481672 RepID=UPI0025B34EE0|nr:hypothetical protein [Trichocoleus desertorum]
MTEFSMPLIFQPHMCQEELEIGVEKLFIRTQARELWLSGGCTTEEFLDLVNEQKIDVFDLADTWESGKL